MSSEAALGKAIYCQPHALFLSLSLSVPCSWNLPTTLWESSGHEEKPWEGVSAHGPIKVAAATSIISRRGRTALGDPAAHLGAAPVTVSGAETLSPQSPAQCGESRAKPNDYYSLKIIYIYIYLNLLSFAASGFSCSTRDLSLWHLGFAAPQHAPEWGFNQPLPCKEDS